MKLVRAWMIAMSFALLAAVATCDKARQLRAEGTPKPEAEDRIGKDWASFPPYPHTRLLCNKCVRGRTSDNKRVGITWTSYPTRDATEKIIAFYSKAE
jgi:hypothetical protein